MEINPDFLNYLISSRDIFISSFKKLKSDVKTKTVTEDLIIAYDQMFDILAKEVDEDIIIYRGFLIFQDKGFFNRIALYQFGSNKIQHLDTVDECKRWIDDFLKIV